MTNPKQKKKIVKKNKGSAKKKNNNSTPANNTKKLNRSKINKNYNLPNKKGSPQSLGIT